MQTLPQHYTKRPHLAFLAEASQILSRSLDPHVVIDEVARLYVPYIADLCTIYLAEDGVLQRMGIAHVDESKRDKLLKRPTALALKGIYADVLRTGEPLFLPDATAKMLPNYASLEDAIADIGVSSAIVLPLGAGGRVFGVMVLSCYESERRFTDEDFLLAAEVARRAGTNIDNARLFHEAECARAEAERARQRSVFLTKVGDTLAAQVDFQEAIDQVAALALENLADGCLIDCTTPEQANSYALAHRATQTHAALHEVFLQHRANAATTRAFLESQQASLEGTHTCVLDLEVRGLAVGTVVLFRDDARPAFNRDDVDLAEQLLRRAAGALDRTWLIADLHKAVRVRDDFLSIASHELRTPLTALELQIGNLTRLMSKPDPLQWHTRFSDKLERANRQTTRLTKLIDNLLDVSRISAGRFRLEPEECDMARLCHDLGDRWADEATAAGCALELTVEAPCEGRWDPLRIEQVFTNLISNAVKYGAGKPIHLALEATEEDILITVRDHGIGVAEDARERIFDRFERAVSPREFCGLGLGLFITRQIVEAHGGAIRVSSELGAGSTFEVSLPRYIEVAPPSHADPAMSFLEDLQRNP